LIESGRRENAGAALDETKRRMNEVLKIVHHRLRAATPSPEALERTHPDADLLTAFAEQALVAASEREDVLQHLALCADCREVVALALPEIHAATPPMEMEEENGVIVETGVAERKARRFSWETLGWAQLRWATLAAGIALAIFVVRPGLERMGKRYTAMNAPANQLSAPVAQPGSAPQVASSAQPANSAAASLADKVRDKVRDKDTARRLVEKRAENTTPSVESKAGAAGAKSAFSSGPRTNPLAPLPEMQLAGNMPPVGGNIKQHDSATRGLFSAGTAATGAKGLQADKPAVSESRAGNSPATVAVASGGEIVPTRDAPSSAPSLMARADGLMVQNAPVQDAPKIEKAKSALDETTRDSAINGKLNESQTATPASKVAVPSAKLSGQSAAWTITDGVLQRSFDSGRTWQPAARAPLKLLCYANRGQDVWVGGQSGTLMHSVDNGATWSAVAVSFNGQSLSSDVVKLGLLGAAQIVLSTNTREIWNSADAGKTWEKK
jgi:hypothetical protein